MNADLIKRLEQHRLYNTTSGPDRAGELIGGENLDFRGIPLEGVCLSDAVVPSSDFTGARMTGAEMYAGNFADCKFIGADLTGAKLNKSTLVHADFTDATLRGAELRRVEFDNTVFRNAVLDGADLTGALLYETDLRGASLRGCNLDRVGFDRVRVAGIDLRGAVNFWREWEHEIDVGDGETPELLSGQAARDWLLARISPERETG